MNLIEALRQADGKPVRRSRGKLSLIVGTCNSLCWFNPTGDSAIAYGMYCDDLLADDWYVVESKSKIEEAIEVALIEVYGGKPSGSLGRVAFSRIVNLTLDEAIKEVDGWRFSQGQETQIIKQINALKVKV